MLKLPNYCKLYTQKCPYYYWGLGETIDELLNPTKIQLEEPFRMKQMNPCCIKHQREILWYLSDLFEKEHIFYWLDFGTLLGAVRGGRSIPHDTDGDMCLLIEDRERVLLYEEKAKRDGFLINNVKPVHSADMHIKVSRSKKNHMIVDLFFWTRDPVEKVYKGDGLNGPKAFPDWWLEKLSRVTMFDKPMWAPREPEKFLRMRFGKDWRIPQNKKVHNSDAIVCHKWGFEYAASQGWLLSNA